MISVSIEAIPSMPIEPTSIDSICINRLSLHLLLQFQLSVHSQIRTSVQQGSTCPAIRRNQRPDENTSQKLGEMTEILWCDRCWLSECPQPVPKSTPSVLKTRGVPVPPISSLPLPGCEQGYVKILFYILCFIFYFCILYFYFHFSI